MKTKFWVGSYTLKAPHVPNACGQGIYRGEIDLDTGALSLVPASALTVNPSYLAIRGNRLVAVSEQRDSAARIYHYRVQDGVLTLEKAEPSGGDSPCHVTWVDGSVVVSNYNGDRMQVFTGHGNVTCEQYCGSGPVASRQASPHIHQTLWIREHALLAVCDLGSDRVWLHRVEQERISPAPQSAIALPPGSGPRHTVWHEASQQLLVIGELSGSIHATRLDGSNLCTYQPECPPSAPAGAAIRLHPGGRMLYASERSESRIDMYAVNETGELSWRKSVSSGGRTPRDFNITPDGRWLICANQDSDNLMVFPLNPITGAFAGSALKSVSCGTPVCVAFDLDARATRGHNIRTKTWDSGRV